MMSTSVPYTVPKEPGLWRAIALAVFVHAVLFAFLWIGISWVNDKPETIEAEVWSTQDLEQAPPRVQTPPPPPEEVKPQPVVKETPTVEQPDIALEQEKIRKEKEKKAKEEEAKKEDQAKQEEADRKKKELEDKQKLADEKRKQDALDAKKLKAMHDADIKRMFSDSDSATTNGTANKAQSSSNNATWYGRIKVIIKSHMHFLVTGDNNDPAEFDVDLLPGGMIAGIRKIKSSGNTGFDDAVRAAIEASEPFPPDSNGKYPVKTLPITYRPKD